MGRWKTERRQQHHMLPQEEQGRHSHVVLDELLDLVAGDLLPVIFHRLVFKIAFEFPRAEENNCPGREKITIMVIVKEISKQNYYSKKNPNKQEIATKASVQ